MLTLDTTFYSFFFLPLLLCKYIFDTVTNHNENNLYAGYLIGGSQGG